MPHIIDGWNNAEYIICIAIYMYAMSIRHIQLFTYKNMFTRRKHQMCFFTLHVFSINKQNESSYSQEHTFQNTDFIFYRFCMPQI